MKSIIGFYKQNLKIGRMNVFVVYILVLGQCFETAELFTSKDPISKYLINTHSYISFYRNRTYVISVTNKKLK